MAMTVTNEDGPPLARAQKRLLRRVYNGRVVPIVTGGKAFLTYKEACHYLLTLDGSAREAAYDAMKAQAKSGERDQPVP